MCTFFFVGQFCQQKVKDILNFFVFGFNIILLLLLGYGTDADNQSTWSHSDYMKQQLRKAHQIDELLTGLTKYIAVDNEGTLVKLKVNTH